MIALWMGLALGAGLEGIKPEKLRAAPVNSEVDGWVAVVDAEGTLWTAQGRSLKARGQPLPGATGLWAGPQVGLWRVDQQGLVAHSEVRLYDPDEKKVLASLAVDAPLLEVAPMGGGLALLFPGELRAIGLSGKGIEPVPLPASTRSLRPSEGGGLQVEGPGWSAPLVLDGATGCPTGPFPETGQLADRIGLRALSLRCQLPLGPHNPALAASAQVDHDVRVLRAFAEGDGVALAAMGFRGERAIAAYRPQAGALLGRFSTKGQTEQAINPRLLGPGMTVVLRDPSPLLDLRAFLSGPYAPACAARVVLAPPAAATVGWWEQAVDRTLAALGPGCGPDVLVARPDEVYSAEELRGDAIVPEVRYLDASARLMGQRSGAAGAVYVRLDLVRAAGGADPLRTFAELPELNAAWTVGPGPVRQLALDVDGSWVAGVGWDLVRATPDNLRQHHQRFLGPVTDVSPQPDGRFLVRVAGQGVRADLDQQRWSPEAAPKAAPTQAGPANPGVWLLEGGVAMRPDPKRKGQLCRVEKLGLPVSRIQANGEGAILETPLGLVGVAADCTPQWRAVDVADHVVSQRFLILASPDGVRGYLIP